MVEGFIIKDWMSNLIKPDAARYDGSTILVAKA